MAELQSFVPHSDEYRLRRFWNWFPMGLTYAFLYMGRYNLTVAQGALGELISKEEFGHIFGVGSIVYGCSFLLNGPLTDRMGGKIALLIAAAGTALMNGAMGWTLQRALADGEAEPGSLRDVYTLLYALNMYFQSFGAVAIVKVNAHWFHVRERGGFSGIFGTMIASGIYFAYDGSERVLGFAKGQGPGGADAQWWVFYAPAVLLIAMLALETFLLKDRPSGAGHADFDTGDASSGDMGSDVPLSTVLRRVVTHPIILTVASIEFCTGVLRQGVMHWFRIFAKEQVGGDVGGALQAPAGALGGWQFMLDNWGLILFVAGVIGANAAGWTSDRFFQSRRGPSAAFLYAILLVSSAGMIFFLPHAWPLAVLAFVGQVAVIGTHGLLSGTATMDFGGRKGAATAVGMIDGFVYLGTGLQSLALGYLTTRSWQYWPIFLAPFALVGLLLCMRIWHAMPGATRKGGH